MTTADDVPRALPPYASLPLLPSGARSGWHVFGEDDQVGLLNLQTPDRVASSARAVVSGDVFPLDVDLSLIDPPLFGRESPRHHVIDLGVGWDLDDRLDRFYPQASSQWDSLAHVGYERDRFYNGATLREVLDEGRNCMGAYAARGIAGRCVLLDVAAVLSARDPSYTPADSLGIDVADLEAARRAAGITWRPGDVMLLHTGWLRWYADQPRHVREELAAQQQLSSVGLTHGEDVLEYLWDSQISAVAADNPAVEQLPFDLSPEAWPLGFLHQCLIGQLGMALGELWWLDDLAVACRRLQRYEAFLTSAPLHLEHGIGSPANAIAIL
ncbi:kynurenine formamidase [Nocardioides zeae]|uniref:Kynurenine formamidase n=1 Tax=Nocardioides zeae TaxID=1457234 RepID=A0ACC6IE07_9ACTN|nr:cyclase family protein [Nocardioides zeae]MDR6174191.1 kynurenine formamidase [Nocardioides zeae]MDR6208998.1 kynurenine formamidase [Nocardioides zeae]